jgi:hypothetical protein
MKKQEADTKSQISMILKIFGFLIIMLTLTAINHWGLTWKSTGHLALGVGLVWLGSRLR